MAFTRTPSSDRVHADALAWITRHQKDHYNDVLRKGLSPAFNERLQELAATLEATQTFSATDVDVQKALRAAKAAGRKDESDQFEEKKYTRGTVDSFVNNYLGLARKELNLPAPRERAASTYSLL